jgi:hypothetical protein
MFLCSGDEETCQTNPGSFFSVSAYEPQAVHIDPHTLKFDVYRHVVGIKEGCY